MCFIVVVKNEFKNNDLSTTSRSLGPRSWLRRYFSRHQQGPASNSDEGQLSVTTVEQPSWPGEHSPNHSRNGIFANQQRAPLPMAPEANEHTTHGWQLPLYTTKNDEERVSTKMDAEICQFCGTREESALVS